MKSVAIAKARDHLNNAKVAVGDLDSSDTITVERAWTDFLSEASRFYSKLEQGVKGCNVSQPWFGRLKAQRKSDQLLSYLHHARNADEHGLERISHAVGYGVSGSLPPSGVVQVTAFGERDENGRWTFRDAKADDGFGNEIKTSLMNARVQLCTVKDDRYNDSFDPPRVHLAEAIEDGSPLGLARLMLLYLDKVLDDASGLPVHT